MHSYRETIQEEKMKERGIFKWIVLTSYCLNVFTNVFLFTASAPIWPFMAIYYKTTDYNLNWLINCYYIGPITTAFLFNPLTIKYFGVSQILSCTFTTLGLWLLVYVKQDFYLGLLAFSFIGIGESIFYQVPLRIYIIIFKICPSFGLTLRIEFCPLLLGNIQETLDQCLATRIQHFILLIQQILEISQEDQQLFNEKYEKMITLNAIFATAALIVNFLTLKEPNDEKDKIQVRETITNSLCKIIKTSEGLYDLASVSACMILIRLLVIGLSWCYPMLFGTQQYFIGQTYLDVIEISIMFFAGQIIAASIYTWKLQQQSNSGMQLEYDKYIKISMYIGFWSLVFEMIFYEDISVFFLAILNFIIGAGIGGQYSVLLESLMEKHFPVQELAISSLLSAVANIEAIIMVMITIIPKVFQYGFQISCYMMIPSYCYITVFYQTQFKRFELEA